LQSVEYITNQNFGRRAFSVVDAIPVVPGAAGAWRKSAIEEVGYYLSDTLGEDMELTWRVRKAGYRIAFEPRAYAYTEAPENISGVFRQRFRWIYGQLQILWKHKDVFFNSKYKWFGWFGTPLVLLDNIFLFLSPLADVQAAISVLSFFAFLSAGASMSPEAWAEMAPLALFLKTMILYCIFFGTEILCGVYAFRIDKEPLRPLWVIVLKQFFYRQLMYIVAYKAIWRALTGWRQSWGVLQRKGTAEVLGAGQK
jgi:cellulose synthase/poly-beta-1,6-N-acetylglucosamine synthase-like glycosyltransferase